MHSSNEKRIQQLKEFLEKELPAEQGDPKSDLELVATVHTRRKTHPVGVYLAQKDGIKDKLTSLLKEFCPKEYPCILGKDSTTGIVGRIHLSSLVVIELRSRSIK